MVVVKVIMVMMVMDIVMVEVKCFKNSLLFFSDFWVVIVIVNLVSTKVQILKF